MTRDRKRTPPKNRKWTEPVSRKEGYRQREEARKAKVEEMTRRVKGKSQEIEDQDNLEVDEDDLTDDAVANSLWREVNARFQAAKVMGTPPKIGTAEELWQKATEYFAWAESNPLREAKVFSTKDGIKRTSLPKLRVFTYEGLCLFLNISRSTYSELQKAGDERGAGMAGVLNFIDSVIREQKFSGAAAELLNSALIARDLGLADRQEISGPEGGPMELSAREVLLDRLSKLSGAAAGPGDSPPKK